MGLILDYAFLTAIIRYKVSNHISKQAFIDHATFIFLLLSFLRRPLFFDFALESSVIRIHLIILIKLLSRQLEGRNRTQRLDSLALRFLPLGLFPLILLRLPILPSFFPLFLLGPGFSQFCSDLPFRLDLVIQYIHLVPFRQDRGKTRGFARL